MYFEINQFFPHKMRPGTATAAARSANTVSHNGRTMQLSANPKPAASFLRTITSFAACFSKAAARKKFAYGAFDVIAKCIHLGGDKDGLGKAFRKEFCENLAASEAYRKPGQADGRARRDRFMAYRLAISTIQMKFPDGGEHLKEIDLEVRKYFGVTDADIETLKDDISNTLGGLRPAAKQGSDAIQKPNVPGQSRNVFQCLILRHRIVEKHLSEAAENFSLAENIPLSNLKQWRAEDSQTFGELAIQYAKALRQQPCYENIAPEIISWIAFRSAQAERHAEGRPAVNAGEVARSGYRMHKESVLSRANEELAQALGKDKEELDAWWELDKTWNAWQSMKDSTTLDPTQRLSKACVEVASSSFIRHPGEDLDQGIESVLRTISDRKFRDLGQDYFKRSKGNPLPELVAGILSDARLQLPPQFFRH